MALSDQRPNDPMTAADAALLIEQVKKMVREELQTVVSQIAMIQSRQLSMFGILQTLSTDLAETRVKRLEEEIFEAERERQILEERMKIVDQKAAMKKASTLGVMDTNERIRKTAELTYAEREKLRLEKRAEWWAETLRQAGRAIVIAFAISLAGGFVGFAWWILQLYLTR